MAGLRGFRASAPHCQVFPVAFARVLLARAILQPMPSVMSAILRHWKKLVLAALLVGAGLCVKAWHDTMRAPEVLRTQVALDGYPVGEPPLTAALISDIHVAGPDMPPDRLARIVEQINALGPDIVMIAGDLVSEKRTATHVYSAEEIVAPLGELDAPLGVVVAPGNHDHWFDWPALQEQLDRHGITVLQNEAAQIGPLVVGGVDDAFTRRDDLPLVVNAMDDLRGGRVILTHSPDIFPQVPPDIALVLAGHTHCGQIRYPWGGTPATMSRYGERFACGEIVEHEQTVIVGAGLGTSLLPLRFGTHPEIWLVELSAP